MGERADLVRKIGAAAVNKQWDVLGECVTEDVKAWSPSYDVQGRAALVETIRMQNEPFEDIQQDVQVLAETDSLVVFEWTWSIPHPTEDGRWSLSGMSVMEFDGRLISNIRQYFDTAAFVQ